MHVFGTAEEIIYELSSISSTNQLVKLVEQFQ